jgi:hypothetical protein
LSSSVGSFELCSVSMLTCAHLDLSPARLSSASHSLAHEAQAVETKTRCPVRVRRPQCATFAFARQQLSITKEGVQAQPRTRTRTLSTGKKKTRIAAPVVASSSPPLSPLSSSSLERRDFLSELLAAAPLPVASSSTATQRTRHEDAASSAAPGRPRLGRSERDGWCCSPSLLGSLVSSKCVNSDPGSAAVCATLVCTTSAGSPADGTRSGKTGSVYPSGPRAATSTRLPGGSTLDVHSVMR